MITFTRLLARHLRAVFRRAGIRPRGGVVPPVLFRGNRDGLAIRAVAPELALEYRASAELSDDEMIVPVSLLDECYGRGDEPVTLESGAKNKVVATWQDRGIPQRCEFDVEPRQQPFPAVPEVC